MDTGARALSRGVEPGDRGARVEVGDDAADRIVGGGGDRDRLVGGVIACFRERRHQRRVAVALDRSQVEARSGPRGDGPCDDVTRSELVDEALATVVEQRRPGAAERLREEEAVMAVVVPQRRGVELDELEVCESSAGGMSEQQSVADRATRVRRPRPERGVAAGGEDRPPSRGGSPSVVMRSPSTRRIRGMLARSGRQDVRDVPSGVRAAGVHDAIAGMSALAAEPVVERDAETP